LDTLGDAYKKEHKKLVDACLLRLIPATLRQGRIQLPLTSREGHLSRDLYLQQFVPKRFNIDQQYLFSIKYCSS
jgi:hypothetical protein